MAEGRFVYLIRHGQTEWNLKGKFQGSKDSPLTDRGRKQAEAVAVSLKRNPPVHLYTSPLGRAQRTAEIIAKGYDIPLEADERLSEQCFGDAEGLNLDEVHARWPDLQQSRERDKWNVSWPEGESYKDVDARLEDFVSKRLQARLRETEAGPLGIVGHQSMNMVLLGRLLGLDPSVVIHLGQPNHVTYRLHGSIVEHAYLGDDDLEWCPGILQKYSDEIVY